MPRLHLFDLKYCKNTKGQFYLTGSAIQKQCRFHTDQRNIPSTAQMNVVANKEIKKPESIEKNRRQNNEGLQEVLLDLVLRDSCVIYLIWLFSSILRLKGKRLQMNIH